MIAWYEERVSTNRPQVAGTVETRGMWLAVSGPDFIFIVDALLWRDWTRSRWQLKVPSGKSAVGMIDDAGSFVLDPESLARLDIDQFNFFEAMTARYRELMHAAGGR